MIRPLWITNCDNTEDRLYESRPCQSTSFFRYLNSVMEKSEAREACFPSLPTMPRPICAFRIIGTSLPPSPTAQVRLPVNFPIFLVMMAFYVGLHLQTQTLGAFVAALKKVSSSREFSRHRSSVYPSIMRIVFSCISKSASSYSVRLAFV